MDRNAAMASSRSDPFFVPDVRLLGPPAGRQAQEKPHVRLVRMVRQGQGQDLQGLGKAVALDQRPRILTRGSDDRWGRSNSTVGPALDAEPGEAAG